MLSITHTLTPSQLVNTSNTVYNFWSSITLLQYNRWFFLVESLLLQNVIPIRRPIGQRLLSLSSPISSTDEIWRVLEEYLILYLCFEINDGNISLTRKKPSFICTPPRFVLLRVPFDWISVSQRVFPRCLSYRP